MEEIIYVDRRGTNCHKWDSPKKMYQRDDILPMSIADMDFKVPDCVQQALKDHIEMGVLGYSAPPEEYYQSFLNWEQNYHNVAVEKEWIRFIPGVVTGIAWLLEQVTVPGDTGIILSPVYGPFSGMLRQHDVNIVSCELKNNRGVYSIDFDDFEAKIIENHVKVFLLCSPHNPVGRVWRKEELCRLVEICQRHSVFIIADEIHQDIIMPGHEHISILSLVEDKEQVAMLTSTAKSFNLAGIKNAFMIVPNETLRKKIDAVQQGSAIRGGNSLGYTAVAAAYAHGRPWLEAVCDQICKNFLYAQDRLKMELPALQISPLEGTFLMWVDFGAYLQPGEDPQRMLVEQQGLLLNSGSFFGGDPYRQFVRINLATSMENVISAVDRIVSLFKDRNT